MRLSSCQNGLSYIEVMVSTVLIVIALSPAMDALYSGIMGSRLYAEQALNQSRVRDKLEQLLAMPFDDLRAQADVVNDPDTALPVPYSDAVGTDLRRVVYVARYDGDNADGDNNVFSGGEYDLLWIRVEVVSPEFSVETLLHE